MKQFCFFVVAVVVVELLKQDLCKSEANINQSFFFLLYFCKFFLFVYCKCFVNVCEGVSEPVCKINGCCECVSWQTKKP